MKRHGIGTLLAVALLAAEAPGFEELLPPMNGQPGDFAPRRAGAEAGASYRIGVTNEGLYRIGFNTLATAGLTNLSGSDVRMFCRTQEVAVFVSTPGTMVLGDYLLFYGRGHDGYYSNTNVYWLAVGPGGARMDYRDAAPIAGATEVTSRFNVAVFHQDARYAPFYRSTDTNLDHWFAALLVTNATTNVHVHTPHRIPSGSALLTVHLQGLTTFAALDPDHQTEMTVNGSPVTTFSYDGETSFVGSAAFSAGVLSDGWSTVSFRQVTTVTNDRAYLERFSIRYTRRLAAPGGAITFASLLGTNNYSVDGFSTNTGFWAVDVSDPAAPVLLTNYAVTAAAGAYRVRFGDLSAATSRYYVCAATNVVGLTGLERVEFRDLASTNRRAGFLLVTPYEFRGGAYRLLKHRHIGGLEVAVAPVTDIYNEFGYGIKDAAAIKQFIGYTFHHWRAPPPKYVLLAGEGTYDPRDNLGHGATDWVPVHLGPTPYDWAALDGWFATVNGADSLVDLAVGRMAVFSNAELANPVAKTIQYEALSRTNAWRKRALLVADDQGPGDPSFRGASITNVNSHLLSNGFERFTAYLDEGSVSSTRSTISNRISSGVFAVSYFGHGAYDLWAAENLFDTNDVARLTNNVWPVFTVLTCKNGAFDDPAVECLAERLVERPNRGAVAVVAASALSIEEAAEVFANGFYEAIVKTNDTPRLGDAMNAGLLKLWTVSPGSSELLFYNIHGDPALVVNPGF